jgi:hypothetical protein
MLSAFLLAAPLIPAHAVDQATTPVQPTTKTRKKPSPQKPAVVPVVLPPMPAGPLPQVPMTQLPAAAPRVTYTDGKLAIAAQNSTLGEILRDVRKLTGASIDIPQGATSERVVAQLGPGAPRDVLALLLNGTSFNYVMLGTASNPASVASLVLTLKPSANGEGQQPQPNAQANTFEQAQQQRPVMPGRMGMPQPFRPQPVGVNTPPNPAPAADAEETNDEAENAEDKEDDSDQQVQPAQQNPPGMIVQPDGGQADQQVDPNQPNGGPKTPEQLLQMMRQAQPPGGPNGQPVNVPPPQE